jgi:FKBP-type peptidyl-prolyl cis-trans isomerase FkpA
MSVTAVPLRPLAKGSVVKLWLALALLTLAAVGLAWWGTADMQRVRTASGLQYQVVEEGEGNTITPADLALVHFIGRRENGEVFASTLGSQPVPAAVGNFVPGFDEALQLMRQGSRYKLWVPPQLGYGDNPPPGAPFEAGETLMFDINVVQVAPGMAAMQRMMGQQGGGPGGPGGPGGAEGPGDPHQGALEGAPPSGAAPEGAAPEGAAPPEPAGNPQGR